ncbi:unnamed protein product [Lymnaea stagnalis]|uniref:C-type lectin domain-containing protein n=1 Tax=Lymnaea stagnalis TaxID=6523 RepID=A0AAV2HE79_LYMST
MERKHVHFLLFFTSISLPAVISVTCRWTGSILSEGSCFLYESTPVFYSVAKSECQSKGGVLATVRSMTQMLESTVQAPDFSSVWIGANDIAVEGTWVWEDDGSTATELTGFWQYDYSQPDNYTATEDCVNIFVTSPTQKRTWDDECDTAYPFLCMEKDQITSADPAVSTSSAAHATSTTIIHASTSTATTPTIATTLTTSTRPTTSTMRPTTTSLKTTTKTTTSKTSTSTTPAKAPATTLQQSGASFTAVNALLVLSVCALKYLVI